MPNSPSPIERILKLEAELDRLRQQLDHETAEVDDSPRVSVSRAIWQADEILLTRLIRRSPEAISAYRAAAELTMCSSICSSSMKPHQSWKTLSFSVFQSLSQWYVGGIGHSSNREK